MTKTSIPKDPAARREYGRLSVALHRAKKAAYVSNLQNSINYHRERLGLPPRHFDNNSNSNNGGSSSRRGSAKLVYLPPEEILRRMTAEELTEWKVEERRKRKLQRAREKKAAEDRRTRELKEELNELERRVGELDAAVQVFVEPVVEEESAVAAAEESGVESGVDATVFEMEEVQSGCIAEEVPSAADFTRALLESPAPEENYTRDNSKPIKNEVTVYSKMNDTADATIKTELFTLDLDMDDPEKYDPLPLDPISNTTKNEDDDYLFEGLEFSMEDPFPIMDDTDELIKDAEEVFKDNHVSALGGDELLFGNDVVAVFDSSSIEI